MFYFLTGLKIQRIKELGLQIPVTVRTLYTFKEENISEGSEDLIK